MSCCIQRLRHELSLSPVPCARNVFKMCHKKILSAALAGENVTKNVFLHNNKENVSPTYFASKNSVENFNKPSFPLAAMGLIM